MTLSGSFTSGAITTLAFANVGTCNLHLHVRLPSSLREVARHDSTPGNAHPRQMTPVRGAGAAGSESMRTGITVRVSQPVDKVLLKAVSSTAKGLN